MKFPKRLKLDRALYYQVPSDTSPIDLHFHEMLFREHYKGIFTERIQYTYFFQLPSPQERDLFLDLLEGMCRCKGLSTKRETIYSR